MESKNVLTDKVHGRPVLFHVAGRSSVVSVAERRDVVRQRVEPNVHDMCFVTRNRYAPTDRRFQTAYREILQAALNERDDLVAARVGPDPERIGLDYLQELFTIVR